MKSELIIYGAYGHTGKFIVSRLHEQGYSPILSGRNKEKLAALNQQFPHLKAVEADINAPGSLDSAFAQAHTIINCAGPYLDTSKPILESALRLGANYLDLSAEQKSVLDIFNQFSDQADKANVIVLPAVAFYGGLGDLLSARLTSGWNEIDTIDIYVGLNSWHPTKGTRLTGERNHYQRLVFADRKLVPLVPSQPTTWEFAKPIGEQKVICVPLTEIITVSRHLNVQNINTFISLNSIEDIRDANTPEPTPTDEKRRSSQQFCMEVVARKGNTTRKITAQGQDIYAVTAPLVVEAVNRIKAGAVQTKGVSTIGEIFNASEFLKSLDPDDISVSRITEMTKQS